MRDYRDLERAYEALPANQKEAVELYRRSPPWAGGGAFAYDLNKLLRTGQSTAQAASALADLDAALQSCRLEHPATVYRAVGDISHLAPLTPGREVRLAGFQSTSLVWSNLNTHLVAENIVSTAGILTLRLPRGTPCIFLGAEPASAAERELLLPRDSVFKVVASGDGDISLLGAKRQHFSGLMQVMLEFVR